MKYRSEPYISERQGKRGFSYTVRIRYGGGELSKTFSEVKYGNSRLAFENAVRFRNKALVDIANNTILKGSNITVGEVFNEFIESSTLSINTKQKHETWLNLYIKHKDVKIQDLTRGDIISDLNAMVDTCSDDTISRVLGVYRKDIVEHALNNDYIVRDITAGLKAPESHVYTIKKDTTTSRVIVDKVIDRLLASQCKNSRLIYYLIEILYYTGMRPAEAEVLTRNDIIGDCIIVNKELGSNKDDYNVVRRPKTQKSIRKVPISKQLRPIINELLIYTKENQLFIRDDGQYLNSTYIGSVLKNVLKGTGINFNLYRLRHNVATELVINNVDQRTTMDILGHSSFDMSLYYANSNDELKKEAIELLS